MMFYCYIANAYLADELMRDAHLSYSPYVGRSRQNMADWIDWI
jgi:hypothetical protein